jgi:hypothetical protein
MKHIFASMTAAFVFSLSAHAQTANVKPTDTFDIYKIEQDYANKQRLEIINSPGCYPVEAGGTGINYTVKVYAKGVGYSWFCKHEDGTWETKTIASKNLSPSVGYSSTPNDLKLELSRLEILNGYDRDAGTFLKTELNAQVAATKPK